MHITAGREQDVVRRDGRRWQQRPRSGRGREVAVGKSRSGTKYTRDSRSHPDPFPTRPHVFDTTITSRTLANNTYSEAFFYQGYGHYLDLEVCLESHPTVGVQHQPLRSSHEELNISPEK